MVCIPIFLVCCILQCSSNQYEHFVGSGLVVRHLRKRSLDECEVNEELPPVETNLQYDFNFQQLNYLPEEIHVKPVSGVCHTYAHLFQKGVPL